MRRKFNRTQRNYIIAGLCMILVIMGVGYAAFQSQLKISGTSNITSNWSVKITDIQSKIVSGTPTNASEPTHTDTTATFRTTLTSPGDTMQYDVTVLNEGDIDAKLDKITVPESTNPAIGFEVSGMEEGSLLEVGQTALLTVTVKYNEVTEQPSNLTADLKVTLDYSQAPDGYVPPAPSESIGGQKVELVESGDGLYVDEYEKGKYTYKGANPNNYITFNDEIWRIISIDSNELIKLIKSRNIDVDIRFGGKGWETSDIKTYLNGEYLNTITTNKDKIVPHTWSIGAVTFDNSDLAGQINSENTVQSQSVNIGMITASEYIRANSNIVQCGNMNIMNTNISTCQNTNWIYNYLPPFSTRGLWTISPDADYSGYGFYAFSKNQYQGTMNSYPININGSYLTGYAPSLYLTSDITLSGSGTHSDPFTIVQ